MSFQSIPILDYALATDPERKPEFLRQLRDALVNVGFFYLSNSSVAREDIDAIIDYAPRFFDLPTEAKQKINMVNSQHFFGYTSLGSEITKGKTDQREQFDFATPFESRAKPGDADFWRLWGPPQWPDEELLPGFKETALRYLAQVEKLSEDLILLFTEAFEVPANSLDIYIKPEGGLQHRAKISKYPAADNLESNQGVGPHFDNGFFTFLLQASDHPGLQVQNLAGEWIDAPPIPGTFVINIGKTLEAVTGNLARATSHRVLSPPKGSTPRYSIPFFQGVGQNILVKDHLLEFKPEILALKDGRPEGAIDSVNYAEIGQVPLGEAAIYGRVRSHPDVAQRHYPELFKRFYPDGSPKQGVAY